jgi:hypothetical protein
MKTARSWAWKSHTITAAQSGRVKPSEYLFSASTNRMYARRSIHQMS